MDEPNDDQEKFLPLSVHHSARSGKDKILSSVVPHILSSSISSLIVILAVHLNTTFQPLPNWTVDVENCACDCWDRKFKGNYSHGGYKHVYFQMTTGSSLLWLWSAAHFIMLLKFVELATACVLGSLFGGGRRGTPKVRWLVLAASCLNFYGMFYNWWITFNYINDAGRNTKSSARHHILLPTQLFFDITEIIPATALYSLLQKSRPLPSSHLLLSSLCISAAHLLLSIWDQGFIHLLTFEGAVLRDVMFIVSDLAGLVGVGWFVHTRLMDHASVLVGGTGSLLVAYVVLKGVVGYR